MGVVPWFIYYIMFKLEPGIFFACPRLLSVDLLAFTHSSRNHITFWKIFETYVYAGERERLPDVHALSQITLPTAVLN